MDNWNCTKRLEDFIHKMLQVIQLVSHSLSYSTLQFNSKDKHAELMLIFEHSKHGFSRWLHLKVFVFLLGEMGAQQQRKNFVKFVIYIAQQRLCEHMHLYSVYSYLPIIYHC